MSEEAKVKLLSVLFVTLTSVNATSKPLVVLPMEKSPGPVMVSLVIEMGRVVGTVAEIFIVAVTSTELVPVAAVLFEPCIVLSVTANAGAAHSPVSIVAAQTPTMPFFKFVSLLMIVPFLTCPYVVGCALRIFRVESPLAFDVQNNFSGRLAGLLVRLAIVAGERGHGGVLSGIKILR